MERQNGAANFFVHKIKNYLGWILKGNWLTLLSNSKIFIIRLELGKIEWKNHLERQNGAAEIFFS